jgi:Holliday junction resolvase RusA-like endonuclease
MERLKYFTITIKGNPIPKARPRVTRTGTYTPQRTKAWEQEVALRYKEAQGPRFDGFVSLEMKFYRSDARRVDLDNLEKAVCDALNGIAYGDDWQIIRKCSAKEIDRDNPRVEIKIGEEELGL